MRPITSISPPTAAVRSTWMSAALTAALCLTLSGCASTAAEPTPSPAKTILGMFASEDEALAAAKEVLFKYRDAIDSIGASADSNMLSSLESLGTTYRISDDADSLKAMVNAGYKVRGTTIFDRIELLSYSQDVLSVTTCQDVSGIRILQISDGTDVTRSDRKIRFPVQITMTPANESLLVDRIEKWPDDAYCN